MATYNGSEFITEQLKTLKDQTRALDEVLIFDDKSTDSTVQIVERYIDENNLQNWKIIINSTNKGYAKNFFDGMLMATGDIVFLCDQDDTWNITKVEKMCEIFENNLKINVLGGSYKANISKNLSLFPKVLYNIHNIFRKRDGKTEKVALRANEGYNMPGWTLCYRNKFLKDRQQYISDYSSHDGLLWRLGIASDSLYKLRMDTGEFRRYNGSTSSFSKNQKDNEKNKNIQVYNAEKLIKATEIINDYILQNNLTKSKVGKIYKIRVKYLNDRMLYLRNKNLLQYLSIFIRYNRYGSVSRWYEDFRYVISK